MAGAPRNDVLRRVKPLSMGIMMFPLLNACMIDDVNERCAKGVVVKVVKRRTGMYDMAAIAAGETRANCGDRGAILEILHCHQGQIENL